MRRRSSSCTRSSFADSRRKATVRCSTNDSSASCARRNASSASLRCRRWSRTSYCLRRASRALRTALTSVTGRRGRSSKVTFPKGARERTADSVLSVLSPPPVRTMTAKSDHGGCVVSLCASISMDSSCSTSSVMIAAPAFSEIAVPSSPIVAQAQTVMADCRKTRQMSTASLPNGAKIRTGMSAVQESVIHRPFPRPEASEGWSSRENSLKLGERRPYVNFVLAEPKLSDGALMPTAALLHHGDRFSDFPVSFEITKNQDIVGEVAYINGCLHGIANQSHLRQYHQSHNAAIVQIGEQLMEMKREVLLSRHGLQKAVQAVNKNDSNNFILHRTSNHVRELAGRNFGGVKVRNADASGLGVGRQVHSQAPRPSQHGINGFFKDEDGRAFSLFGGCAEPA